MGVTVLHLVQAGPTTGGTVSHVVALATGQARTGAHVTVAAPQPGVLTDELAANGIHCLIDPGLGVMSPDNNWQVLQDFLTSRHVGRPDVIHAHLPHAGLACIALARRTGAPMVYTQHMGQCHDAVTATLACRSPSSPYQVIAVASYAVRELASELPFERISCVPNGVEVPRDNGFRVQGRGAPSICYYGRLSKEKGPDTAVIAFSMILDLYPDAHLHIIGTGPEEPLLRKLVSVLDIVDAVTFYGSVPGALSPHLNVDLLLAPSREDAASLVVCEAMACGVPVITTDVGGTRDIIGPEGVDRVIPPNDAGATFRAAVSWLRTSDPARADSLFAARHRYFSLFSHESMIRNTLDVYEDLLSRHQICDMSVGFETP